VSLSFHYSDGLADLWKTGSGQVGKWANGNRLSLRGEVTREHQQNTAGQTFH
jgi:hypothetical protein